MWAQMISIRLKENSEREILDIMETLRGIEQPNSGLLRQLVFRDRADPQVIRTLALFESEEMARARETDPRRLVVQASVQAKLAQVVDGQPTFADLDVLVDFTY